mmetsp:Transcript_54513/g.100369  ORF Transcript_54513/g.100369 Transcript_54513/m.100369 type:complete len:1126 (-) Transcript_54513:53-3430(-)
MEHTPEHETGEPGSPAVTPASPGFIPESKSRLPGGGPVGRTPLVRAMRMKQGDMSSVTHKWLDRYEKDKDSGMAELVSLVLVIADVPLNITIEKEDILNREPSDVMLEVTSALAVEATEKGADFTAHWLVSRERGAMRARENYAAFWKTLITATTHEVLLAGLVQSLSSWMLALAECQFRSVRHAATFAGLHLVDGLGLQCSSLRSYIANAQAQIRDAEAQGGSVSGTGGSGERLTSLAADVDQARQFAHGMASSRDTTGLALMSRRTKDVDAEVRRSCFEAMNRWAQTDPESFLDQVWVRYLLFGLHDRDAKARTAALSALLELLKGNPSVAAPAVQSLAEHVKPRVLERCHDVDPAVGAAAVRCTAALAARKLLAEEEYDPVIDLAWDAAPQRCSEAAVFVSRHVFNEDILDYSAEPTEPAPTAGSGTTTRRRVQTLVQFVTEYTEGCYQLVDRLVGALWRRTTCLEDWEVFASLALPGSEHSQSGNPHTALIHLMDAVARRAVADTLPSASDDKVPSAPYAQEVLHRAARALAPQLPHLITACQAEPVCMRRAASLSHLVLQHCASRLNFFGNCDALLKSLDGPAGEEAAKSLKNAFLRQPDSEALEHIASGLSHLLNLSKAARPVVRELARSLHSRFVELAQHLGAPEEAEAGHSADALFVASTRLRMLTKAYDVSLCDVHHFVVPLMEILDDRARAIDEGKQPAVAPQLVIVLLELASLVFVRQTIASFQPEMMVHCVAHDDMDEADLKLLPTAVNDFFNISTALLKSDPNQHVRTAALGSTICLLTAWWNTVFYTNMGSTAKADASPIWGLPLSEELTQALSSHLSQLLIDANAVPPGTGGYARVPEPGNPQQSSAFSQLFTVLSRAAAGSVGISEAAAAAAIRDADRVRLAALACSLIATCRHDDFVNGQLPALVLSQGLSAREDLQEVAWMLLRRLRKNAYKLASAGDSSGAEEFFRMLLRAVFAVHKDDAGASVAKDLSYALLQHVGVGKLSDLLQAGCIVALQEGTDLALQDSTREGFLEALVPWITKHTMSDNVLLDLAIWVENRPEELGIGKSTDPQAIRAGLATFVYACRATAKRGAAAAESPGSPEAPAAGDPSTPTVKRSLEEAFEGANS